MSEKFTSSFQEQPNPKKKIENQKDPNGFWWKNVYELHNRVEKINKPEAKEFFDFRWLITQNRNGKSGMDINVSAYGDLQKDPKTGKFKMVENTTKLRESTITHYQTFQGNTLTINIDLSWDLNVDDDRYHINTKKEPDRQNQYDHDFDFENSEDWVPIPEYDSSRQRNELKLQMLPNGIITYQEKTFIYHGNKDKNPIWSIPKVLDWKRAADFIAQLKNKFLERYVNREKDRGITDNDLNYLLDKVNWRKDN